jgi:hypothetical protein
VISASEATDKIQRIVIRVEDADGCFDILRLKNIHAWAVDQQVWLGISAFAPTESNDAEVTA